MKSIPPFELNTTPLAHGTTLIEASAGTGKTYTIAGLFVRLILEEDLAVGEILVTTYTKPATAELRERIRTRLREALEMLQRGAADDPFLAGLIARHHEDATACPRLERAVRQFDEAPIYTIHGFCQRMLQDRAFESGVPFSAELIEDQRPIIQEVAEDFWRRQFYESDPIFTLAALHRKVSPALLARLLEESANKPLLRIIPPRGRLAELQSELRAFFHGLRALWQEGEAEISGHFLGNNGWAKGSSFQGCREKMQAVLAACAAPEGAPLSAFTGLGELAQSRIDKGARRNVRPPKHALYEFCERFESLTQEFASALKAEFLHEALTDLADRKRRRNVLSFDDLLTRLHGALEGPGGSSLAALIRGRFRAALIDEFQDTDALQEASFRSIFESANGWLFLIGDPKQAIYAFRGADVFSYLTAAERAQHAFTLKTNFRSERRLVEAVNTVFHQNPDPFGSERIPFRPVEASGRADEKPLEIGGQRIPPLRFWWWEEDAPIASATAWDRLPRSTAAAIAELLNGSATLGGRAVEPGDFAVLVATHQQAQAVQGVLARLRIPTVLHSNANVFASCEAEDLQTVLTALVEPSRDGRIRAALATSLWSETAAGIEALTSSEPRWQSVLLRFHHYHQVWSCEGFMKMFRELLQAEHVRVRLLGREDGERRLTNLLHLAELLHQAACARRLGMAALVKWLAEQRAPGALADEERELRLERDEHAVQVVTMHKSKGLEYNIVLCPFSWRRSDLRKDQSIVFHDRRDRDQLTIDLSAPADEAHSALAKEEQLAENLRLLYVALTRARHQCHFVWGRFKTHEFSAASWLLHPPAAGKGDTMAAFQAHVDALTPMQMRADLEALVAAAPHAIAVDNLPSEDAAPYAPPLASRGSLNPRHFRGRIERDWRMASFTSLSAARDSETPDFDQLAAATPDATALTGVHALPRGAKAGIFFHEIFQELDFQAPATIEPLVARKLMAFGFAADFQSAACECVRRAIAVPLRDAAPLSGISQAARLNELEFSFPFSRITSARLAEILAPAPTQIGRVQFDPQRGFLRGFIDLIFESGGRFHIVDYKSNWLGADRSAYGDEALRAEMERHHYVLQYHLYTIALHRYLAQRIRDYSYERHFGGVHYLFLRGLDPADPANGVFHDRPALALITALDALFSAPQTP